VSFEPPEGVPPHINVWRSVREGGDTKTEKSRRTLAIAGYVAAVLVEHRKRQAAIKAKAGDAWRENGLVFPSLVGTEQDSHNVRRSFRSALRLVPGLVPQEWTPRDLRHSFVSILSEHGLPIEEISRLMGHSGIAVTELVYRHELRPVLQAGAAVMDVVFPVRTDDGADDDDAA
jgi:integrase